MVSNKCVTFRESSGEIFSKPKLFKEPKGLIEVDLSKPKKKCYFTNDKTVVMQYKNKLFYIFMSTVFMALGCGILITFLNIKGISKLSLLENELRELENYDRIKTELIIKNLLETKIFDPNKCQQTKTVEDCCEIFTNYDLLHTLEFCTVDRILELILKYNLKQENQQISSTIQNYTNSLKNNERRKRNWNGFHQNTPVKYFIVPQRFNQPKYPMIEIPKTHIKNFPSADNLYLENNEGKHFKAVEPKIYYMYPHLHQENEYQQDESIKGRMQNVVKISPTEKNMASKFNKSNEEIIATSNKERQSSFHSLKNSQESPQTILEETPQENEYDYEQDEYFRGSMQNAVKISPTEKNVIDMPSKFNRNDEKIMETQNKEKQSSFHLLKKSEESPQTILEETTQQNIIKINQRMEEFSQIKFPTNYTNAFEEVTTESIYLEEPEANYLSPLQDFTENPFPIEEEEEDLPSLLKTVKAELNPITANGTEMNLVDGNFEMKTDNASGVIRLSGNNDESSKPLEFSLDEKLDDSLITNDADETSTTSTEKNKNFDDSILEQIESTTLSDEMDLKFRINQGSNDFNKNTFSSASVDFQTNQQSSVNPCFNPFSSSFFPGYQINQQVSFPYDPSQFMKSSIFINPPVHAYPPPSYYPPFWQPGFFNSNGMKFLPNFPPFPSNPNMMPTTGQFNPNWCTPNNQQMNNVAGIPGVEIRKSKDALNLQELLQQLKIENDMRNKSRQSIMCPLHSIGCSDGTRCLRQNQICDGNVNCKDASDEAFCSCKQRIAKIRWCDGYFDCPNGEDEEQCFGCSSKQFNCNDWSRNRKATCISPEKHCDGVIDCPTGKDESDCFILTDHVEEHQPYRISNAVGFLHRFYKSKWYPTCKGTEVAALKVCNAEAGKSEMLPSVTMIQTNVEDVGLFINITSNDKVSFTDICFDNKLPFIQCPPLMCGIRVIPKNLFRGQEIDTSIEDMLMNIYDKRASSLEEEEEDTFLSKGSSRVVGGKASQAAAWPWAVTIYRNGIFHCGGVIINELWILTAAHCSHKHWLFYYEIKAGILRRFSYSPMQQNRHASHVITYQFYDHEHLKNDIALMKLSAPVRFNRYVRPICLPSPNTAGFFYKQEPSAGTVCTTVGWGSTVEHGEDPDHLREVEIPILEKCKYKEDVDGKEICAGLVSGGKDACQGDSGGPLMCRNPNNLEQWYLAGIVSHGEGCARPNEPGVYTRVSLYLDWINDNTGEDNIPSTQPLQSCPGYKCKGTKSCLPKKRRCDRIVDCLFADDETNCDTQPSKDLFKYAFLSDEELLRSPVKNFKKLESNLQEKFKCKKLLQIIPFDKKCDQKVNCEDGSDELNCTCAEYLKNSNITALCDGIVDCADLSDELNCVECTADDFLCRESKLCIPVINVCNGFADCPMQEDERDCIALTDGKSLILDSNMRPRLSSSGILTHYNNGSWSPFCDNWMNYNASVASNVCNYLGFHDYIKFKPIQFLNTYNTFQVYFQSIQLEEIEFFSENSTCTGFYVKCTNKPLSLVENRGSTNVFDLHFLPWNAAIYIDGIYRCMAIIISKKCLLSTTECSTQILKLNRFYVTALIGVTKLYLNVESPNEQILQIIDSISIGNTNITLLHLNEEIKYSRYAQPINLSYRREKEKEVCVAIGTNPKGEYDYLPLVSLNNCNSSLLKCYVMEETANVNCSADTEKLFLTGTIFCDAGDGWYPSALFHKNDGICGFSKISYFVSIIALKQKIEKAIDKEYSVILPPHCSGFRCHLGLCINNKNICNGIPNCRNGEDEEEEFCQKQKQKCQATNSCASCYPHEMKCFNGKCIDKSLFCNQKNDCGDYSDEPDECSCKAYLELTDKSKICDGKINCKDKTDELHCPCSNHNFKCNGSSTCIAKDMVCDGIPDCSKREDEENCLLMKSNSLNSSSGEVMTRLAGNIYHGCFPDNLYTTQLEDICRKLGYIGGHGTRIPQVNKNDNVTALKPVLDNFEVIVLRRERGNRFKLHMRNGDEDYVKFINDRNCSRLFIHCL